MDGGAAIFIVVKMNHNKDIEGIRLSKPFVRNILRVCVVSYVMLAIENIADETKPCAIIMASDPIHPQRVFDINPEMRIPI
jgi:hypothetical protein